MKKRKPLINHYSAWKYVALVVALVITLFSALPTWYGEDASILVTSDTSETLSQQRVYRHLTRLDIGVKRVDQTAQTPNQLEVVLDDPSQQALARSELNHLTGGKAQVTYSLSPAAPDWLLQLGFKPIKLGLDLRGGVQFLLDVDMGPVYHAQSEWLSEQLRQFLRQQQIRQVQVSIGKDDEVLLRHLDHEHFAAVSDLLHLNYPEWKLLSSHNNGHTIKLGEGEKGKLRLLTVQQVLQTMRSRIGELGITEAVVQRQGPKRIRIELPGIQDPATAKSVIGATASLAFYAVNNGGYGGQALTSTEGQTVHVARKPVLTGEHIIDARASIGELGRPEVNIVLDRQGGHRMLEFSRENIGKPMATVYSEYSSGGNGKVQEHTEVISVATIESSLGERFRITGSGSLAESQQLALLLRAGSLSAPVTIVEERTIGPSLGEENIENGFSALGLGLGATLLFMGLYYRRLGWVAGVALVSNLVLLLGLLGLLPGTVLTLPGIAGLVLTVGMAVDTNVLIFERIREKLGEGYSLARAIDLGFDGSFSTIMDANITTLITAAVLYGVGNGPVQGFALTMGLGLLTSMFSGIFISRAIINLIWGRDSRRKLRV